MSLPDDGSGDDRSAAAPSEVRRALPLVLGAVAAVFLFLFAVRMLGTATETLAPTLERTFRLVVVGDLSALGASWAVSYLLLNGSVVAAIAISLTSAGILSEPELFLMVAGSRLGAAGIVVLVGGLDYVTERRYTLREATSLGILTFVVTHSVFLPATVLGYLMITALRFPLPAVPEVSFRITILETVAEVIEGLTGLIGAAPVFVLSIAVFVASLRLFDRVLERVETARLRRWTAVSLRNRWVALGIGLLVTAATTSVAFSLGVIVPIYNRGYVTRREMVPYVLGANIGTFSDTLIVAVVLGTSVGVATVAALIGTAAVATGVALLSNERYVGAVESAHARIIADRRLFATVLVALVIVPLGFTALR